MTNALIKKEKRCQKFLSPPFENTARNKDIRRRPSRVLGCHWILEFQRENDKN